MDVFFDLPRTIKVNGIIIAKSFIKRYFRDICNIFYKPV